MKVMLLYPEWTGEYGIFSCFARRAGVYPPNLAYLAAIAEREGHEVRIIDAQVEGMSQDRIVSDVLKFKPNIIGMTATTPFFHIAVSLARKLKGDSPIIIGGSHITILKERAFDSVFDYAFIGEADESFPLFLEGGERGEDVSGVKGVLYRENGGVRFTGEAESVYDLDSLPVPARHLLRMDRYKIGTLQGRKKFASIMTMRGCPFKCIYCSTQISGKRVRKRSPELVAKEIESVIREYNIRHFIFLDDTLTVDRKHILKICDLIKELKITFEGGSRADLVDEELISRMVDAGLTRFSFGLESVDENIRRIMRKEVPLESYIIANKLTNKYGVETLNSCMVGLPGETLDTIKKTLSFLRDSRDIKQANISIAVPYPGTELYEMAKRGDYGLKLLVDDFSKFRRYNSAVMSVNGLSPDDLIKLQDDAFASIYLAPWRWRPMLKKSGIVGVFLTFSRLIKSIVRGRLSLLMVDKDYWRSDGQDN